MSTRSTFPNLENSRSKSDCRVSFSKLPTKIALIFGTLTSYRQITNYRNPRKPKLHKNRLDSQENERKGENLGRRLGRIQRKQYLERGRGTNPSEDGIREKRGLSWAVYIQTKPKLAPAIGIGGATY